MLFFYLLYLNKGAHEYPQYIGVSVDELSLVHFALCSFQFLAILLSKLTTRVNVSSIQKQLVKTVVIKIRGKRQCRPSFIPTAIYLMAHRIGEGQASDRKIAQ